MTIATDGYGPGEGVATWGYSFLEQIIVKAKIILEMLKREISLALIKTYEMTLEPRQRQIGVEVVGPFMEMGATKTTIDLEMTKTNIDIELEVVE